MARRARRQTSLPIPKQWATHCAQYVFNIHCTTREHDCSDTCINHVKQKLQAKQSLRSDKVPSFRVLALSRETNLFEEQTAARQAPCPTSLTQTIETNNVDAKSGETSL